jgi:hypothetical protein
MIHLQHLKLILLFSGTIPVFPRLQCGLTAVNSWCERWNIKINEWIKHSICFSRTLRVPDDLLQWNWRDIPFVKNVTCLGVTFDRRMARRHHIETTVTKALRMYVRTYFLFKSGCLSTNIKLTLYNALIRSVMTYACPTWEYTADAHLYKQQRLQNRALSAIEKILTGAHQSANCMLFSKFLTCMIT